MTFVLVAGLLIPQAGDAEIRALVEGLGHADIELRGRAEKSLLEHGARAVRELHNAAGSSSPEGAERARRVLAGIASSLRSSFERSIAAPKGLTIRFAFRGVVVEKGVEGHPREAEGTITIAPQGRFRLDTTRRVGFSGERRVVADGTRIFIETGDGKQEIVPSPPDLGEGVRLLVTGTGLSAALWNLPRPGTFEPFPGAKTEPSLLTLLGKTVRSKNTCTQPTVRPGKDSLEIAFKVLLDPSDPGDACEVTLVLDAATLLPRGRRVEHRHPESPEPVFRTTETYTLWKEGELAEDAFRIPVK